MPHMLAPLCQLKPLKEHDVGLATYKKAVTIPAINPLSSSDVRASTTRTFCNGTVGMQKLSKNLEATSKF